MSRHDTIKPQDCTKNSKSIRKSRGNTWNHTARLSTIHIFLFIGIVGAAAIWSRTNPPATTHDKQTTRKRKRRNRYRGGSTGPGGRQATQANRCPQSARRVYRDMGWGSLSNRPPTQNSETAKYFFDIKKRKPPFKWFY